MLWFDLEIGQSVLTVKVWEIKVEEIIIPVLTNSGSEFSYFVDDLISIENFDGMFISQQQQALNFRHRMSEPGYYSNWHVAGDPTLIIIRSGTLRIGLRDGNHRDFKAGDMFIAKDKLPESGSFNEQLHGHTASVAGDTVLSAVHIKLNKVN